MVYKISGIDRYLSSYAIDKLAPNQQFFEIIFTVYPASWVCASESEPFCVLLMLVEVAGGVRSIEVRRYAL